MLAAHFSPTHTVPTAYLRHPPAPSQRPSVPHEVAPWSAHTLRLSTAPLASGVHLPFDDVSAQLRHAPVQAVSQQTPSTQKFDLQSVAFVQAPPFCLGPQLPFTQAIPATQSVSAVHFLLHAPATQRNGVHTSTPGGWQVPTAVARSRPC
jgi:hypothetical protein